MGPRTCWIAIALSLLAPPARAQSSPPSPSSSSSPQLSPAAEHLQRGLRYFNVQEYGPAMSEFKQAYELDPKPSYLFNYAQAQRLGGLCEDAIRSYRAFLRSNPAPNWAATAQTNIDKCEKELAARPPAAAVAAPPPAAAPPAAAPPTTPPVTTTTTVTTPPRRRAWYKDPLGDVLAAGGLLICGAGIGLWKWGLDDVEAANSASLYKDYLAHANGAEAREVAGIAMVGVGGALVIGGVARWIALRRRR
jgi:tetratricopeptide (TPR) repeat protein